MDGIAKTASSLSTHCDLLPCGDVLNVKTLIPTFGTIAFPSYAQREQTKNLVAVLLLLEQLSSSNAPGLLVSCYSRAMMMHWVSFCVGGLILSAMEMI